MDVSVPTAKPYLPTVTAKLTNSGSSGKGATLATLGGGTITTTNGRDAIKTAENTGPAVVVSGTSNTAGQTETTLVENGINRDTDNTTVTGKEVTTGALDVDITVDVAALVNAGKNITNLPGNLKAVGVGVVGDVYAVGMVTYAKIDEEKAKEYAFGKQYALNKQEDKLNNSGAPCNSINCRSAEELKTGMLESGLSEGYIKGADERLVAMEKTTINDTTFWKAKHGWTGYNDATKLSALNNILANQLAGLKFNAPTTILLDVLGKGTDAEYSPKNEKITFNNSATGYTDFGETFSTLMHETTHKIQNEGVASGKVKDYVGSKGVTIKDKAVMACSYGVGTCTPEHKANFLQLGEDNKYNTIYDKDPAELEGWYVGKKVASFNSVKSVAPNTARPKGTKVGVPPPPTNPLPPKDNQVNVINK